MQYYLPELGIKQSDPWTFRSMYTLLDCPSPSLRVTMQVLMMEIHSKDERLNMSVEKEGVDMLFHDKIVTECNESFLGVTSCAVDPTRTVLASHNDGWTKHYCYYSVLLSNLIK